MTKHSPEDEEGKLEVDEDIFPAIDDDTPLNDEDDDLSPIEPILGKEDPVPDEEKQVMRLEVPIRTIVTVVLSIFVVWLILQINQILLLMVISFLLTLALVPPVAWFERRGMPRIAGVGITFLILIGLIVGSSPSSCRRW